MKAKLNRPADSARSIASLPARLGILLIAVTLSACDPGPAPAAKIEASASVPVPGQIIVDPDNSAWFKYHRGGPHFLAGAGDPEDFLYRGALRADGTRNGDQERIIARLAESGANGIYFQTIRSHGGDGDATHNPFVGHQPENGLNDAVLEQWLVWLTALDQAEIAIYLFFYDDSAEVWETGDVVSAEERHYFEALVNRFEHLRHLVWVIAEEYEERLTPSRVSQLAAIIRAADDHGHPIGVHKLSSLRFSEFADDPNIDQFTIQYNKATASELHEGMLEARIAAAGRYNVNMSEARGHGTGTEARLKSWAVAMAGAYVMVLGMDVVKTARTDLEDLGRLRRFMESTDFHLMVPDDRRAAANTDYVLARHPASYIAYAADLPENGMLGVSDMVAGEYELRFLDILTGDEQTRRVTADDGVNAWTIPAGWQGEVVVYIRSTAGDTATDAFEQRAGTVISTPKLVAPAGLSGDNRPPVVQDSVVRTTHAKPAVISLTLDDTDGPGPYTFEIVARPRFGEISASGNDVVYTPENDFTGSDSFDWRVTDSMNYSETATVTILVQE